MNHSVNYGIVKRLGENIRFGDDIIKASLKSSTSAVYNLANRAYYIEGQAFKGSYRVGDYFSRECEPESVYMAATIVSEPLAMDLVYLYAMRCNAKITIERYKRRKPDENRDIKDIFEEAYSDIPVYTMILPHRYMLSEKDRVIMKTNVGGEYTDLAYYVENVGNAVAEDDGYGIDTVQLSLDTRS